MSQNPFNPTLWKPVEGFENLTDIDYRIHGSGTNMPGRNLVLLVESRF